jgi:hypothetical protein
MSGDAEKRALARGRDGWCRGIVGIKTVWEYDLIEPTKGCFNDRKATHFKEETDFA